MQLVDLIWRGLEIPTHFDQQSNDSLRLLIYEELGGAALAAPNTRNRLIRQAEEKAKVWLHGYRRGWDAANRR